MHVGEYLCGYRRRGIHSAARFGCLPGVTRELLLDVVRAPGIKVIQRALKPQDLERADQVFITSTTRDLLPAFHRRLENPQ